MAYREEETKANSPQGADPSAKNKSVITEKGVGSVQRPATIGSIRADVATRNAQKSLNAWHIRQSKEAGYSDREFDHTKNV